MKCDNLILTTPDIGNKIKISKNCSKILYFFHSIVSTSMVYKKDAFYNYTHICCVGRHQIEELSVSLSSKKKNIKLFEVGYPYFDYLLEKKKEIKKLETDKKNVLIAPSWNPSSTYSHSYIYEKTITDLLKNQYKVTFRPHPEFIKRFTNDFNKFIQLFETEENFYINSDKNNFQILCNSDYLITDWSGIAFEYAYIFKRPVIFANVKKKVLNIDYDKYNQLPIEITEREEIGLIYNIKGKDKILELINKINNNKSIYDKKIEDSLKRNIFNPGNSSSFIANLIN